LEEFPFLSTPDVDLLVCIPNKSQPVVNQLVNIRLLIVWHANERIHIWDAEKGELLQTVNGAGDGVLDLRVSGDGSKIFCLYKRSIQAWDIWTGEAMGSETLYYNPEKFLITNGSKVWFEDSTTIPQGWDFGIPGQSPIRLPHTLPDSLHLSDTKLWEVNQSRIKDVVTGNFVFQLPGRFGQPIHIQYIGQHLFLCLKSGGVLILDIAHIIK